MKYKSLLLVDDDEDDEEIFRSALKQIPNSIHCEAYQDASEALEALRTKHNFPDLIFLDLNMPVMNGQEFLVEIKRNEILKAIPVIVYSTSSHKPTIDLMKDLGAIDFITKPNNHKDLVKALTSILN